MAFAKVLGAVVGVGSAAYIGPALKDRVEGAAWVRKVSAGGKVDWENAKSFFDLGANDIDGNWVDFSKYKGRVCLVVNVATL
jgi:hypothetical protein